jgi:hypothetical protein
MWIVYLLVVVAAVIVTVLVTRLRMYSYFEREKNGLHAVAQGI